MKQTADDFRKFIEMSVLSVIQDLSGKPDFQSKKAQKIAELTLNLIRPEMTIEELYQNAVKLDDDMSELAPVVFAVMKEYEKTHESKALQLVSKLIKDGNYEDAGSAVKKVLAYKAQ